MPVTGRIHDRALLDALETLDPERFEGTAWRVTRRGREPTRGSGAQGRWSAGNDSEVLYTSLEREGALAEIGYRLSLQPIWPSRMEHEIQTLRVQADSVLRFADLASLAPLGVDIARYQSLDYDATQAIAAAARFLEFDGLIVPNARLAGLNLVLFTERPIGLELAESHPVDWEAWRRRGSRPPSPN